jgi:hypothetical protein
MKRFITVVLLAIFAASVFGCGDSEAERERQAELARLRAELAEVNQRRDVESKWYQAGLFGLGLLAVGGLIIGAGLGSAARKDAGAARRVTRIGGQDEV